MPSILSTLNTTEHIRHILDRTSNQIQHSVQQLSSGQRIGSAQDDAAGLCISTRLGITAKACSTVKRDMSDGISLIQIADGALGSIQQNLQRARELALQSLNGTLAASDRAALQTEYQQLLQQIDTTANGTVAFDRYPLRGPREAGSTPRLSDVFSLGDVFGSSGQTVMMSSGIKPVAFIPKGAVNVQIQIDSFSADDDLQLFTMDGRHVAGTPLSDQVWTSNGINSGADMQSQVFLPEFGFTSGASYDPGALLSGATTFTDVTGLPDSAPLALNQTFHGMDIAYSGDGEYQDGSPNDGGVNASTLERVRIDKTTEPLILMVVGNGVFNATASWDAMPTQPDPLPPGYGPIPIVVDAGFGRAPQSIDIEPVPADTTSLALINTGIESADKARWAVDALSAAINRVSTHRSTLGSLSNRFESIIDVQSVSGEAQAAGASRIMDADMAAGMAELSRAQIVSNSAQAMLAQANVKPAQALEALLGSIRQHS